MEPLAWHGMLRLRDDRVIAPDVASRRRLARIVLASGEAPRLLAFRVADTHVHLLVQTDRATAGEFGRRVALAWTKLGGPGFSPAHWVPVADQRHLTNAFRYILGQEQRHGLRSDPGHDGSNLPDLLGLRLLGAHTIAVVRQLLPRLTRQDLLDLLGISLLQEASGPLEALSDAAAAAVCSHTLAGNDLDIAAARRSAVHVGLRGAPTAAVAEALDLSVRAVQRLYLGDADPALARAIALQLDLRARVSAGGEVSAPPMAPRNPANCAI